MPGQNKIWRSRMKASHSIWLWISLMIGNFPHICRLKTIIHSKHPFQAGVLSCCLALIHNTGWTNWAWKSSNSSIETDSSRRVRKLCKNALKLTNLERLSDRRTELCLRFAKKCIKSQQDLFPLDENNHHEKYFVIDWMQRLLNSAL